MTSSPSRGPTKAAPLGASWRLWPCRVFLLAAGQGEARLTRGSRITNQAAVGFVAASAPRNSGAKHGAPYCHFRSPWPSKGTAVPGQMADSKAHIRHIGGDLHWTGRASRQNAAKAPIVLMHKCTAPICHFLEFPLAHLPPLPLQVVHHDQDFQPCYFPS